MEEEGAWWHRLTQLPPSTLHEPSGFAGSCSGSPRGQEAWPCARARLLPWINILTASSEATVSESLMTPGRKRFVKYVHSEAHG